MIDNNIDCNRFAQYAAVIGIDWADKTHVLATATPPFRDKPLISKLSQSTADLCDWIVKLQENYPAQRVAVIIEQRKGALIHFLSEFDFIDIYPIEPVTLKNYRKTIYTSGAKSDPIDASLALEFAIKHPEKLRLWAAPSHNVRFLALLTEDRRGSVDLRARFGQKMTSSLKMYYPLVLDLFDRDIHSNLVCEFIKRWPTLELLQRARESTLRKFFYLHGSRSEELIARRIAAIQAAKPLTQDPALLEALSFRCKCLAEQIQTLNAQIRAYEDQIDPIFKKLDQHQIFASLPGAGQHLTPRLAVLFGEDTSRFRDASEIHRISGSAPVVRQSGSSQIVLMRWACSTFHRQTVVEFALSSILHCNWAKAFYELSLPKNKQASMGIRYTIARKLAYKWIRIIFRCWVTNTPYDDAKYTESLRKAGSPIWAHLKAQNLVSA